MCQFLLWHCALNLCIQLFELHTVTNTLPVLWDANDVFKCKPHRRVCCGTAGDTSSCLVSSECWALKYLYEVIEGQDRTELLQGNYQNLKCLGYWNIKQKLYNWVDMQYSWEKGDILVPSDLISLVTGQSSSSCSFSQRTFWKPTKYSKSRTTVSSRSILRIILLHGNVMTKNIFRLLFLRELEGPSEMSNSQNRQEFTWELTNWTLEKYWHVHYSLVINTPQ